MPDIPNPGRSARISYYTELAHSSGMDRAQIEEPGISPREKVKRLFGYLANINNTVQWSWFIELSRDLFGFQGDQIDQSNWEDLYELALSKMQSPQWKIRSSSKARSRRFSLPMILMTPWKDSIRRDTFHAFGLMILVFHLAQPKVRERLISSSGVSFRPIWIASVKRLIVCL